MVPFPQLNFRRTPVTLIVAGVAVALEVVCTLDEARRGFYYMEMKMGLLSLIWSGEIWRPFTSALLHGSILHAAFNVYMTVLFGQVLESRLGPWRYLGVFVLLGYVSNLPQFLLTNLNTPLDGQAGCVGLSGILYGLFGILWVGRRWRPEFRAVCNNDTVRVLVFWFFFCIVLTQLNLMSIGNVAHGAGLVFGVIYGFAMFADKRRVLWTALAAVATVLVLGTMIACPGHGLYKRHKEQELHRRWLQQLQQGSVSHRQPLRRQGAHPSIYESATPPAQHRASQAGAAPSSLASPSRASFARHSSRSRQRFRLAQLGSWASRKSASVAGIRPAAANRAMTSRSGRLRCIASSR